MSDDAGGEAGPERDTLLIEDEGLQDGFVMLPRVVLRARNLSRDAKLLYAVLLDYAWQERRCFPGYERLCAEMGASEPAVRKYMRELEAVALLSQKRRGLGKTNIYVLLAVAKSLLMPAPSRTKETFVLERKFSDLQDRKKLSVPIRKIKTEIIETDDTTPPPPRRGRARTRAKPDYTGGKYGHLVQE